MMKKLFNGILSVVSPLAAVPTGWAIFAGITEQPAFPVPPVWAGIGAVAVVVVNFAAGMLITDVDNFNHSNTEAEQKYSYPLWRAWGVLVIGILAEIVLSLLIVVFPIAIKFGVLAFPIMTLAGVFVISIRSALIQREEERDFRRIETAEQLRKEQEKAEQEAQARKEQEAQEKQEARERRRQLREERKQAAQVVPQVAPSVAQVARKNVKDEELLAYFQANPGVSDAQVAQVFGVSRQAIGQRRKKLYSIP